MKHKNIIKIIPLMLLLLFLSSVVVESRILFFQNSFGTAIRIRDIDYIDNCSKAMYDSDLITNRPLDIRTGRTAIDSSFDDYTYIMSPADSCFFNRTQFWVYVTAYSGFTNVTIKINCKLINNTFVNRSILATAKGKYYPLNSNEYVMMSNRSMITSKFGTGSISYTINQSRWGVVYRIGFNAWKIRDSGIEIGLSTKSVNVSFNNETLHFNFTGENITDFNRNIFTGAGDRSGLFFKNCSVTVEDYQNMGSIPKYLITGTLKYLNVTNSFLSTLYPNLCVLQGGEKEFANFKDVIMNHLTFSYGNISLDNVLMENYSGFLYPSYIRHAYDVTIKNSDYAVALSNYPIVIRDSNFENNKFLFVSILANIKHFFIDCVSDNWNTIPTNLFNANGGLNRSYTFNIRIVNSTSNISGATWKLINKTGTILYSGVSGINGLIGEQIVSHSTWNNLNSVIPISHNPYRLNITKIGYRDIEFEINISDKINMTVFLPVGNGSSCFDPNTSENWLYLGSTLTLDDSQFFLFILIGLWSYFIYLFYTYKEVIFSFCIIGTGIPLGIILSGVAYYNSFPFGYLITFIVILISFLIPSYAVYKKKEKEKKH
jgi:hypothetical protein